MTEQNQTLSQKKILLFWLPLAATWIMMSTEGNFLAAIIARLAEPKYNLAAYGVAFSFALIIEAPIIMIMSASTALVRDKQSFLKLRNFTYFLNACLTGIILIVIFPSLFYFLTITLIGLPENIARLTHHAMILLIPWPAAIGYRRFFHGILIRNNLTRRVAYSTTIRMLTMATTALILFSFFELDGALVGAAALSAGVCIEALASRFMVRQLVKRLLSGEELEESGKGPLTYRSITSFYYPLALTSMIALGAHPIITFFLGQSRMAIDSLAVWPVIVSLSFILISLGLSTQEVIIALIGDKFENYKPLKKFSLALTFIVFLIMTFFVYTPVSALWLRTVSGLTIELSEFALKPLAYYIFIPAASVWLCFQRSILVAARRTGLVTVASGIEIVFIVSVLFITVQYLDFVGVIAAVTAFNVARVFSVSYLFFACRKVLRPGRLGAS